jgi:PucR family transcriptional regulator, purine catabolism regulatory protein
VHGVSTKLPSFDAKGGRCCVRDLLALPELRRGHPIVLAGLAGLDREVTWVHVLELSHVRGLLSGGELVLLTGVALPDSNERLRRWIDDLVEMDVSGVVVQLGERWTTVPAALVRAADCAGLPLVGLQTTVPFVAVTRAATVAILSSSHGELEQLTRVHRIFHQIMLAGGPDSDVVKAVADAMDASVVLEDLNHDVVCLHASPGTDIATLLGDWHRRSRRDGAWEGWVIHDVTARGHTWGRLIALPDRAAVIRRSHRTALVLGAESIAVRRTTAATYGADAGADDGMHGRYGLLHDLLWGRWSRAEQTLRADAAGFPLSHRTICGVAVVGDAVQGRAAARAAVAVGLDVVLGPDGSGLVSIPATADVCRETTRWAVRLRRNTPEVVVGLGSPGVTGEELRRSVSDAAVAAAAESSVSGRARRAVVAIPDVHVRALIGGLIDDPRMHSYVERELGPLLDPDRAVELAALRAYLRSGRNKSAAAQDCRVSRQAFYARLQRAADLLGADLDDPETCLSLEVAVIATAMSAARRGGRAAAERGCERPSHLATG